MKATFVDRESLRIHVVAQHGRDARLDDAALLRACGHADLTIAWLHRPPAPGLENRLRGLGIDLRVPGTLNLTSINVDMACEALLLDHLDALTLVSGNGALRPLVDRLVAAGIQVRVAFPRAGVSGDLCVPGVEAIYLDTNDIVSRANA